MLLPGGYNMLWSSWGNTTTTFAQLFQKYLVVEVVEEENEQI